jgi:aryl sulfotransferase
MAAFIRVRPPTTEYRQYVSDSRRWARFTPRAGDIVVCTPPKCGTTWMQTIVANLLFPEGDFPTPVMTVAPWLEARFAPLDDVLARLDAQTHRRSIKTHTPADGIPMFADASYIVVGRDGRDAFMSYTNHVACRRADMVARLAASGALEGIAPPAPVPADIHDFFASWLADGALFHFVASYWQLRAEPNVLFMHYDDLKADLPAAMRRVADFLGIALDDAAWPGVVARCGFECMRADADRIGAFDELFVGGGRAFFHKGTNGRWRDVLTRAELDAYARRASELLPPDAHAWLDRSV